MSKKKKINVRQIIIDSLKDQKAVERALLVLDSNDLWNSQGQAIKTLSLQRAKYLASWIKQGKRLTGRFVEEARRLALDHVEELIRPSLEKAKKDIKEKERRIVYLKEWAKACEDALQKRLPFDKKTQPKEGNLIEEGEPIWEVCCKEGLY